jgi:DNA-binding PadR family transcriptional regulator
MPRGRPKRVVTLTAEDVATLERWRGARPPHRRWRSARGSCWPVRQANPIRSLPAKRA